MTNDFTIMTGIVGLVFLAAGAVMRFLPPRKINSLYGYRTGSSMRNIDTWNAANRYSSKVMMIVGLVLALIGFISSLFPTIGPSRFGWGIGLLLLAVVVLFVTTENHLKKHFNKDGDRR